jgi:homoserine kinase type II
MSAYRTLTADDLERVRALAGADAIAACEPITAGIENSNWFLTLHYGARPVACVLTLAEAVPADELPFFIALTDALAEADLPVPMVLRLAGGQRQFLLQEKPALLLPRMPGAHIDAATPALCRAAGSMLAQLHRHGQRCAFRRERPDHLWWPAAFASIAALLPRTVHDELGAALLDATRTFVLARTLPHGVIHGDYFRDNVLVIGNDISAVLDFFHATHDLLAWDIAIALNDWAVHAGQPQAQLAEAFIAGYEQVRVLETGERERLPALRRAAAARFWLSRWLAAQRPAAAGAPVQRKAPEDMQQLWLALQAR